jgi:hypothetical protein
MQGKRGKIRVSEVGEVVKCIVCGKVLEGEVTLCDFCGCPVCEDCVCYSEEPYYGCHVFCLDCWVK